MSKPCIAQLGEFAFIARDSVMHLFYAQGPDFAVSGHAPGCISHAVSDDLINWRGLDPALTPGQPGEWDDLGLWAGSCLEHEGRFLLAYTGVSAPDRTQRIGLAVSDDLVTWERCANNPVMSPNPSEYETSGPEGPAAWRAPWMMWDQGSSSFYAAITARINSGISEERGCIALAESRDALTWQVLPPLAAPGLYRCMEAPQPFDVDGQWFLLHTVREQDYSEMALLQIAPERVLSGPHYLIAHDLLSGWRVPRMDVLAGARGPAIGGCRVVEWQGTRLLLHSGPGRCAVALPKLLVVEGDDRLDCRYWPGLDALRAEPAFGAVPALALDSGVRFCGPADGFILEAELESVSGRAGLVCAAGPEGSGFAALVNARDQVVEAVNLTTGESISHAPWTVASDLLLALKLVSDGDMAELYVNDRFALAFALPAPHAGQIGVMCDGGPASFGNVRADKTTMTVVT